MKIVKRKLVDIKFDKNQPRKTFKKDFIKQLANSIKQDGMVNLIEIDKNDIIITGELRFRALKHLRIKEYDFELVENLTDFERKIRQLAENLLREDLGFEEREDKVYETFNESGMTQEAFGKRVGLNRTNLAKILQAKEVRDNLKGEEKCEDFTNISTYTLTQIASLPKTSQIRIVEDVIEGRLPPSLVGKEAVEEKQTLIIKQEIKDKKLDDRKESRFRYLLELIRQREKEILPVLESNLHFLQKKYEMVGDSVYKRYKDELKFSKNDPDLVLTVLGEYEIDDELTVSLEALKSERRERERQIEEINAEILKIRDEMATEHSERENYITELCAISESIENTQDAVRREYLNIESYKKEMEELR